MRNSNRPSPPPRDLVVLLTSITVVFFLARPLAGQSKDRLMGTWVLDLAKSSFVPDNPPQKRTLVFTPKDNQVQSVMRTTVNGGLDNGMISESDFTAKYDGKDYEISESILDTVSLKKIDPNTIERIGKIRGVAVETATMKLSPDGKLLTITTKGSVSGRSYSSIQVFEKE